MLEKTSYHTFRGKRWRLVSVPSRRLDHDRGECENPTSSGKTIRINRELSGEGMLDTLIHEALHACLWDLDDEAVEPTAKDMARMLWRLGYRPKEEHDVER